MKQYVKQISLMGIVSVSTIMAAPKLHDQLSADIQELVVQLAQICNQECSKGSRAKLRDLLGEFKQVTVLQADLLKTGMPFEQVVTHKKVLACIDVCQHKGPAVYEKVMAELEQKGRLTDVMMTVQSMVDSFFASRDWSSMTTEKQIEYTLLVIDTALENIA